MGRVVPEIGDLEFAAFVPSCSIDTKHRYPWELLVPLIERPYEADVRLDSHDTARTRDFIHAFRTCHESFPDSFLRHLSCQIPAFTSR